MIFCLVPSFACKYYIIFEYLIPSDWHYLGEVVETLEGGTKLQEVGHQTGSTGRDTCLVLGILSKPHDLRGHKQQEELNRFCLANVS